MNLARYETELAGTAGLRAGATGGPAYGDSSEELAQLHRLAQLTLEDATPLAHDAAMAYREVMGDRRQREQAADNAAQHRGSTYL